jgi:GTP cyclohydrolase I
VDAVHLCMMMRGVEKTGSSTVTTAFRGVYAEDPELRAEFFRLTEGR